MEMGNDPIGNIQRINNTLAGIEKKCSGAKERLNNVQQQFLTAQEEAAKPFPKENELKEKVKRLAELDALLNLDDKGLSETLESENPKKKNQVHEHRPYTLSDLKRMKQEYTNSRISRLPQNIVGKENDSR